MSRRRPSPPPTIDVADLTRYRTSLRHAERIAAAYARMQSSVFLHTDAEMAMQTAAELADLRDLLPAIRAGARALRGKQRWAEWRRFEPTLGEEACEDAEVLEGFAAFVDRLTRGKA